MKIKRGDFGYIASRKKKALLGTLAMALLGIIVFLIGLFLNDMSNRNLFTVISVLFVLPGAKFLVAYIVLFPYHSTSKEQYKKINQIIPENMKLYTDLVITSSEKIMHLDFVAIGNGQLIGLLGEGKQEISYVRQYLTKGVKNWGPDYKVKILENESKFIGEVSRIEPVTVDLEEEKKVKSFMTSLIV